MSRKPAAPARLLAAGHVIAEYSDGSNVQPSLSARPYLHPVTTLSGTVVTELAPGDHVHHLGVSLALPDVNGSSFWGGTTFVRDRGSVMLDNHGVQRRDSFDAADDRITEQLTWLARGGSPLIAENRELRTAPVAAGWALSWHSRLTAIEDLEIGSPATNGRPGAGYGGIFWRFPFATARVLSATGEGELAVHGAASPWLAVVNGDAGLRTSVLLVQNGDDPWFMRAEEYVGGGPAVAWDTPRLVRSGDTLELGLTALVLDRLIEDAADAHQLVSALAAAL